MGGDWEGGGGFGGSRGLGIWVLSAWVGVGGFLGVVTGGGHKGLGVFAVSCCFVVWGVGVFGSSPPPPGLGVWLFGVFFWLLWVFGLFFGVFCVVFGYCVATVWVLCGLRVSCGGFWGHFRVPFGGWGV